MTTNKNPNKLIRLSKEFTFEASHQLINHDGKCARLHGHSWKAIVTLKDNAARTYKTGPKENMLVDYADIKKAVAPLVEEYLDHHHLNETLQSDMPTSEYVAKWLFDKLKPTLPTLESICIKETCTSECEYFESLEHEHHPLEAL